VNIKALKQLSTVVVCIAGCAPADDSSIEVTTPNELGVATLTVDRFTDGDARVFELRGLDAAGQQQALVRLRTGTIADASQWFPTGTDDFGSEIITSIGGNDARYVTRETQMFALEASDPTSEHFLAIEAVASTLAREANILVPPVGIGDETPFVVGACSTSHLLTSPVANQCCYSFAAAPSTFGGGTKFYNATTNKIASRKINKYGYGCRASDGLSACSGSLCYYGPLGFARAVFTDPPTPYWRIEPLQEPDKCGVAGFQTPVSPVYGNMTGTGAVGQGCPGGSDGKWQWDY